MVLPGIAPVLLGVFMGFTFGVWNFLAARLDPLADDTPSALLLFYGPIFAIWGLAGFAVTRRTRRLLDGAKVGATVAFVTFTVFTFAVIVRVNLSLDTVSQRADWQNLIRRFQSSGFESLRTYANYVYASGAPFKILVATAIGATAGVVGGCCDILSRRTGPTGTRRLASHDER